MKPSVGVETKMYKNKRIMESLELLSFAPGSTRAKPRADLAQLLSLASFEQHFLLQLTP